MEGHGWFEYGNGDYYFGKFKNNLFCGHGTKVNHDGEKYEGHWMDDEVNGVGYLEDPQGGIVYGKW